MWLMKSSVKWLLISLAVLLVLGMVLVVAVITLVDPARYRAIATDAVEQATSRKLTLAGDVGLKFLPCCAVELGEATLGNPPGFSGEPFLKVGSAELAIRLWPLLRRREVEIGTVRLEGLTANLVGRKDGSNNWSFGDVAGEPATEGAAGNGVTTISVAGISISDARLEYSDEADGSRYRIEDLQLTTGPLRGAEPFDLSTSLRLTDFRNKSGGAISLKATMNVAVDGDTTRARLLDVDVALDLKRVAGLEAIGGRLLAPALDVEIAADTVITAPETILDLQLAGTGLPGEPLPLKATLNGLRYAVDPGLGTLATLTAATTVAGVVLDVTGAGSFGARNDLRGGLRFTAFSPREVLTALKEDVPVTADSTVLGQLSGSASWFLKDDMAGVEKLDVVLDDTRIGGSLSRELLSAVSKATPRTRFDLTVDTLNADRYLEPDAAPEAKRADGKPAETPPAEIPVETIRGLNLEGRARVGRLTINGMQLADVDVTSKAAGGRLNMEPVAAKLYGGSFRGAIRLDAAGPTPRLTLDQKIAGANFGAMLADLADVKNITGTMSLKLDGAATGSTDEELLQNLAGNLAFTLADGVYEGMDVWYEIRKARALLKRTNPPARAAVEQTPIRAIDLAGTLGAGKLRTERFSAEIPFLRVSGDTTVDFRKGSLDSRLTALVFEKPVFGDDTSLADLEGVRLPLTVSGPVEDPKVRVDLSKMLRGALKDTARETLRDTLMNKLGLGKPAAGEAPAGEEPPAEGEEAAPTGEKKEDPLKKALDRIFR